MVASTITVLAYFGAYKYPRFIMQLEGIFDDLHLNNEHVVPLQNF